jgi:hypothetical protein
MDTLFGIAVVGVWIAISVVALKRAYGTRGPSPKSRPPRGLPSSCAFDRGAGSISRDSSSAMMPPPQ